MTIEIRHQEGEAYAVAACATCHRLITDVGTAVVRWPIGASEPTPPLIVHRRECDVSAAETMAVDLDAFLADLVANVGAGHLAKGDVVERQGVELEARSAS